MAKIEYWAKMTCQGQLKRKVHCKYLWQACFYVRRWIKKYGKYETMQFDIEAH